MTARRIMVIVLVALLGVLPAFGLTAEQANAATSRVAIIQSLAGTVTVKKSGGSKEFRAFARMSLNEGDILTTSANSTAVLQFANGTSADDKMTVSANTTLTFSKLSDRGGTRTKVSMFNGKAWVDVKSIVNNNDEFTLETPNAIMGVRGTHLLVSVDPLTGSTRLTVVAGVVSTVTSDGSEAAEVVPGDDALVTKSADNTDEITIAPSDLDLLMQQTDASIIEAIIAAAGDIAKENQEKLDEYFEDEEAPETELERKKSNVENLLGAIVDSAVRNGVITEERVNQLVAEAQAQTGVVIDLSKKDLILSDEEKQQQEEQRRKEQESAQQAEEARMAAEEQRNQNEELLRQLEEERRQKIEENQRAEEEKRQQAEERYMEQLDEAEKQQFEERKQEAESGQPSSSPSPDSSPSPSPAPQAPGTQDPGPGPDLSNTALTLLKVTSSELEGNIMFKEFENFMTPNWQGIVPVPVSIDSFVVHAVTADPNAAVVVKVDEDEHGMPPNQPNRFTIDLKDGLVSKIDVEVTAPDGITKKIYSLLVHYEPNDQTSGSYPAFLDGWVTTVGGSPLEWTELGDDEYPTFKLDLSEYTEDVQLKLYFDDANYKVLAYSPALPLPFPGYGAFFQDDNLGSVYATWTESGQTRTLPLWLAGTERVVLTLIRKDDPWSTSAGKALLFIQNEQLPIIIYSMEKVGQQYPVRTGPNRFLLPISYFFNNFYLYTFYYPHSYPPMNVSVSSDYDGLNLTKQKDEVHLVEWGIQGDPIVQFNIQAADKITGQLQENYMLTLVEENHAELQLSSVKVSYVSNGTEVEEDLVFSSFSNSVDVENPDASTITLEPVLASSDAADIQIYQDGDLLPMNGNKAAATIHSGKNEFAFVIRPSGSDEASPASVHQLNVFKFYPDNHITDLRINGQSISMQSYEDIAVLTAPQTSSVSLSLATETGIDSWGIFDWNRRELVQPDQGQYTLPLHDEWNRFSIYPLFPLADSYVDRSFDLEIYRGDPESVEYVEDIYFYMEDSYGYTLFEWDEFDPAEPEHQIEIKVWYEAVRDTYMNIKTVRFDGITYEVKASVNEGPFESIDLYTDEFVDLMTGLNTVEIAVKAILDANQTVVYDKTFTIRIDRKPSENAYLESVAFEANGEQYVYEAYMNSNFQLDTYVEEAIFTEVNPEDPKSKVEFSINGSQWETAAASVVIPINQGENILIIKVTSEDESFTEEYEMTIHNPEP